MGIAFVISCCVCAALGALAGRQTRRHARFDAEAPAASEANLRRLGGLAAEELRNTAMRLGGLARQPAAADTAPLMSISTQILRLAGDLEQAMGQDGRVPVLRLERVALSPAVTRAIATVNEMLGAAQHWQVARDVDATVLLADRRALHQVLVRVLANAARSCAANDFVELHLERHGEDLALVVQDEGSGLAEGDPGAAASVVDSRGIGLDLTLARTMMQAHGGRLTVEAATRVGTRVSLVFPPACIADAGNAREEAPPAFF